MAGMLIVHLVASFTPPLPSTKALPRSRGADRMLAIPDMSPNSLLFTQDHGPTLNYFTGGNLKALWESVPRLEVRDCCTPLCYCVGGNLMALWASVMESHNQCLSTQKHAVTAGRRAAVSMSDAAPRCMSDDPSVDYFAGGNLVSLWKATRVAKPREHRMRRAVARSRSPGVVAFGAAACPLDAEDLNFFSGGSLRCLWLRCRHSMSMQAERSSEAVAECMRGSPLNFFAGGDLVELWKAVE